jgi:hypothetical protein
VLHSFGARGYNWNGAVEIQRDLGRGISIAAGYYRRWYENFTATDNLEVTSADYQTYCVTAPSDVRLPGGGGYPVCGLADVSQAKFGRVVNRVSRAEVFGKQSEVYDGFDLTGKARFRNGALVSGGMNIGRTETDRCFVLDSPQELLNCHVAPPFQPNFKFLGVYPLPFWGVQTSAVFQAIPGPEITATRLYTNAEVLPSLNRNLSGAGGTVNVPLVKPGTMYADASQQLDVRLSKSVRFLRSGRIQGNVDIFNVFNASGVQTLTVTYGPAWQRATLIQGARSVMFGAQLEF